MNDLINQIRLGEETLLEFKNLQYKGYQVVGPHRNSMADELAAMANTDHGVFLLGVDDKTKTIVGIPIEKIDVVEQWIMGICNDLIEPKLNYYIRKLPIITDDTEEQIIIRLDVRKSLIVHKSPGGYFHRIGSSKRQMDTNYLTGFIQQRSQTRVINFDLQLVTDAHPDCLEKTLWGKFKTNLSPEDDDEFLQKLKLIKKDSDGQNYPTVGGLLMASKRPDEFLPHAYIQAVAYRGTERDAAYQIDAKDLYGPLDVQIDKACHFVYKNMRVYAIKNPTRLDIPQYDMRAILESIVNAIIHRDYYNYKSKIRLHMFSDRLEIFSPGALANSMTIENIPLLQATRNELIASLIARCPINPSEYIKSNRKNLMDKRGEGVPIILTKSKNLSGRIPEYREIDQMELLLTIYATPPPNI
ncbi:MAG: putative DNA binding domain-containing protein [Flavobacteriaceae bacterium]|nr:putative DNA binding domain-containing protein [Flavobacteriaceae bacterium]